MLFRRALEPQTRAPKNPAICSEGKRLQRVNIKKSTKKNGITVYREQIYLGIDCMTGKQVYTTISAPTKKNSNKNVSSK